MNKSVENEEIQKFLLYSGHDTTRKSIISLKVVDVLNLISCSGPHPGCPPSGHYVMAIICFHDADGVVRNEGEILCAIGIQWTSVTSEIL